MKLIYENFPDRYIFSTSKNITFPKHMHTGLEIFYVSDGEVIVTVGNTESRLTAGGLAVAFPNQIHSYLTEDKHNSGILILCPAEVSGEFLPELLKYHPLEPFLHAGRIHDDVRYALSSLLKTSPGDKTNHLVVKAYIQLILARVLPQLQMIKNHDNQALTLTEAIITYMSDYYTDPISLEILARRFGISRYAVSRIFNEKLHTGFNEYLNTLRIDYAKLLLQGSNEDILTISIMCGYETLRTFNRSFQKICGCSPREYRRSVLK